MTHTPSGDKYIEVKKYSIPHAGDITIMNSGDIHISKGGDKNDFTIIRESEGIVDSFPSMTLTKDNQMTKEIAKSVAGAATSAVTSTIVTAGLAAL